MAKWKEEKARPSYESHELKGKYLKMCVLNGHVCSPGEWVFHCYKLGFNTHSLYVDNAADAKKKAVEIVKNQLERMLDELSETEGTL